MIHCIAGFTCSHHKYVWTEEYVLITIFDIKGNSSGHDQQGTCLYEDEILVMCRKTIKV